MFRKGFKLQRFSAYMRLIKTKKSFRKEFRRQLRYAIAAAAGFSIIFAWRSAIWSAVYNLVEKFQENTRFAATGILTAITITLISVLIILLSSKLLKD